jgi:peptide/nickel transport system ATP-binding protein
MNPLLQVQNLTQHFSVPVPQGWRQGQATLRAVDGISFSLSAGQTLGLVGESGCGKTTTARLVLGLMPATQGQVLFEGQPVSAHRDATWRALRRRMQMVYQNPLGALDRRLPVITQVLEPLKIHTPGDAHEHTAQAQALMASLGLPPSLWHRYPHELSGGQRQRVVLSRALILKPSLLVCDEPVSALDVSIQAQVINLLQDVQERMGVAYLFISHDLKVVRQVSDQVAVMYLGQIVEQAAPDQLYGEPLHPYAQALVASVPSLVQRHKKPSMLLQGEPPNPLLLQTGCVFQQRCPHVQAICREQAPLLRPVGRERRVACHWVANDALDVAVSTAAPAEVLA